MKTDIQIAQEATLLPISEIAAKVGLGPDEIVPYGHDKAKVPPASTPPLPAKGSPRLPWGWRML